MHIVFWKTYFKWNI